MYYYSMNNNGMSKFLNKQNIELLWDVLLDELRIDRNNKQIYTNIRAVFESNINPFSKNGNSNANNIPLVNLNKQFLSQVVIAVNRLFPTLKQEQDFKRIQISSEDVSEPYKVEDIHSERQNNFEKQVQQKRSEFEKSINLNKPAELDFTDKLDDGKIKEMDTLIAETMARRKFDIEQIQHNLNTEDPENWLQSQQIKKQDTNNTNTNTNTTVEVGLYRKLKLKPIDTNTNTNTNTSKKNVTWTDQQLTNTTNENISLVIKEVPDKLDILINKVDILIDLITNLANQSVKNSYVKNSYVENQSVTVNSLDPTCSEI